MEMRVPRVGMHNMAKYVGSECENAVRHTVAVRFDKFVSQVEETSSKK